MRQEGWRIPASADPATGEVVLGMATPQTVAIRQGDSVLELTTEQLGELSDRIFYLHELLRIDLADIAEGLQPSW
ncbi:hypothetical protein OOZ19_22800 [Saccharopolyspora sp. NFXS83]|uniref:hypothetical protein n=1 Tax=Saccharopolyspora sp. NFXS83 TaxID=2993560 RepID=UPI00224AF65B|nr:hypothetical protein [Saccharopolyspora sp. NFXS83]MCX2733080.1 hypothetical protein [Saccharopolyspora sp. NFXS83]